MYAYISFPLGKQKFPQHETKVSPVGKNSFPGGKKLKLPIIGL